MSHPIHQRDFHFPVRHQSVLSPQNEQSFMERILIDKISKVFFSSAIGTSVISAYLLLQKGPSTPMLMLSGCGLGAGVCGLLVLRLLKTIDKQEEHAIRSMQTVYEIFQRSQDILERSREEAFFPRTPLLYERIKHDVPFYQSTIPCSL